MSEQEIIDICTKYRIKNYTINQDGSIDVNGNVNLSSLELTELPLKFNRVSGYFSCSLNKLTSLEGCPSYVGGDFYCSWNELTSLDGYNLPYDKLICNNKDKLIRKHKLKLLDKLL